MRVETDGISRLPVPHARGLADKHWLLMPFMAKVKVPHSRWVLVALKVRIVKEKQ